MFDLYGIGPSPWFVDQLKRNIKAEQQQQTQPTTDVTEANEGSTEENPPTVPFDVGTVAGASVLGVGTMGYGLWKGAGGLATAGS